MANATLQAALNGGSPHTGAITASLNDVVQLSGVSTVGWTQQRFEIVSYPDTFPTPSGWTKDSQTGVIFYAASAIPPTFTMTLWGKYMLRLIVNNGLTGGANDPTLTYEDTAISILSPNLHLLDTGYDEANQFSSFKQWVESIQANWRVIETAYSTFATGLYNSTPAAVSTSGAVGVSTLAARGDHVHAITFATVQTILGGATGAISVNGQAITNLSAITVPATATFAWNQAPPGAGTAPTDAAFSAQGAAGGDAKDGAGFYFTSGAPGDVSHKGGNFTIDFGSLNGSGTSGALVLYAGHSYSVPVLQVNQAVFNGVSDTALFTAAEIALFAYGTTTSLRVGDNIIDMKSSGASRLTIDDAGTRVLFGYTLDAGSNKIANLTEADFAAAAATPLVTQTQVGGTGAAAGTTLTVKAQKGQQQSGTNANNNGGVLVLSGGDPGTGGSGAAGVRGNVQMVGGGLTMTLSSSGLDGGGAAITNVPSVTSSALALTLSASTKVLLGVPLDMNGNALTNLLSVTVPATATFVWSQAAPLATVAPTSATFTGQNAHSGDALDGAGFTFQMGAPGSGGHFDGPFTIQGSSAAPLLTVQPNGPRLLVSMDEIAFDDSQTPIFRQKQKANTGGTNNGIDLTIQAQHGQPNGSVGTLGGSVVLSGGSQSGTSGGWYGNVVLGLPSGVETPQTGHGGGLVIMCFPNQHVPTANMTHGWQFYEDGSGNLVVRSPSGNIRTVALL